MTDLDVKTLQDKLIANLKAEVALRQLQNPFMIGIHTGGVWIAERLHRELGITEPLGVLNISFYRDDFSQIGMHPQVKPSKLPSTLEERDIILVDDVLYSGRTIRAALNEIFDYGRPKNVVLAVLIDRNGRQLPIQADCSGGHVTLASGQRVKLTGPDPLEFFIQQV